MTDSQPQRAISNATGGARGVVEHGETFEARKSPRWRVACINWSRANVPHAVAYYIDGSDICDRYFTTWVEAIEWADEIARKAK